MLKKRVEVLSPMVPCLPFLLTGTSRVKKLNSVERKIQEYKKINVCVEDAYTQIYKIAYLKCKEIEFNKSDFEEKFKENSFFIINSAEGSIELNKKLDLANIDDQKDKKIHRSRHCFISI